MEVEDPPPAAAPAPPVPPLSLPIPIVRRGAGEEAPLLPSLSASKDDGGDSPRVVGKASATGSMPTGMINRKAKARRARSEHSTRAASPREGHHPGSAAAAAAVAVASGGFGHDIAAGLPERLPSSPAPAETSLGSTGLGDTSWWADGNGTTMALAAPPPTALPALPAMPAADQRGVPPGALPPLPPLAIEETGTRTASAHEPGSASRGSINSTAGEACRRGSAASHLAGGGSPGTCFSSIDAAAAAAAAAALSGGGCGIWPEPFPGYKGLFVYEVAEDSRESDKLLGNGVFLWRLEILSDRTCFGTPCSGSWEVPILCHMKKQLVSTPPDACQLMRNQVGKYIIEEWYGQAELRQKYFNLTATAEEPVECTIDFTGLPLTRSILAGTYEMELKDDDRRIKAVHASWVHYAKLNPEDAAGYMYRIDHGSKVCPLLKPADHDNLDNKLQQAHSMLHGAQVYHIKERRYVHYKPTAFHVLEVSTMTSTFDAVLEVSMEFLISRDDVFNYVMMPEGWAPSWVPEPFQVLNAKDATTVTVTTHPPTLKIVESDLGREIRGSIAVSYRGTFGDQMDLHSFPFDVQPLHVKLHVDQDPGIVMARSDDNVDGLMQKLENKWTISEFRLLHLHCGIAQLGRADTSSSSRSTVAHMFVVCVVQRCARSYIIRIIGVITLICMLSVCIFVIEADGVAEMIGHAFMMMLALTTYSLVMGDIQPVLGYLTILDQVVLLSFGFLAVLTLQVTFIGSLDDLDKDNDYEWYVRHFAAGDIIAILVIGICAASYICLCVLPKERAKCIEDKGGKDFLGGPSGSKSRFRSRSR